MSPVLFIANQTDNSLFTIHSWTLSSSASYHFYTLQSLIYILNDFLHISLVPLAMTFPAHGPVMPDDDVAYTAASRIYASQGSLAVIVASLHRISLCS